MIVLASASPRRQQLLKLIYPDFAVRPANCDESSDLHDPAARSVQLALRKAGTLAKQCAPEDTVIAADTMVYLHGHILEKPRTPAEARQMLLSLSGETHTVYTGVAVCHGGQSYSFCSQTDVTFCPLPAWQIDAYVASGEPMDKAGAYGIQGAGALLVERIDGDFYNVMGLPVSQLHQLLLRIGAAGPVERTTK